MSVPHSILQCYMYVYAFAWQVHTMVDLKQQ